MESLHGSGDFFCGEELCLLLASQILPSSLTIYPVPSSSIIIIRLDQVNQGEVEIYAMDGKLMDAFKLMGEKELNIEKYESGTYLIMCHIEGGITLTKEIIRL